MKGYLTLILIVLLFWGVSTGVHAGEAKKSGDGTIKGFVEIWTQDILYLENEIVNLKSECGR